MHIQKNLAALVFLAFLTFSSQFSNARAQGTAFTYQGWLSSGANPANGSYDLAFTLFATNAIGVALAGPVTNTAIAVNNGLFTTMIDFGTGAFTGGSNWLEIAVRTNGGGSFSTLTPRQQLTPAPYAITAGNLAAVVQNNAFIPGEYETIGGGSGNTASNFFATVGGGSLNSAVGFNATVAGGFGNYASGNTATVAGGQYDYSTGSYSTVGGGNNNVSSNSYATVAGGYLNTAGGYAATVGGGYQNKSTLDYATVSGGYNNLASGLYAMVAGGYNNLAAGSFSFAAGYQAQALQYGSFVWNDESGGSFSSSIPNSFSVRAAGGVLLAADVAISGGATAYHHLSLNGGNSTGYLYGSYPAFGDGVHLSYNYYADNSGLGHVINGGGGTSRITVSYGEILLYVGGVSAAPLTTRLDATTTGVTVYGTFNNLSDRNAKQNFASVSPSQLLDKVMRLPISEWSYKEDAATRHLGPVAQDFHSVFSLGTDDKHIAPIDEGGVALAAIQGLNEKVESGKRKAEAQMEKLSAENAELKARLEKLEQLINARNGSGR